MKTEFFFDHPETGPFSIKANEFGDAIHEACDRVGLQLVGARAVPPMVEPVQVGDTKVVLFKTGNKILPFKPTGAPAANAQNTAIDTIN